MKITNDKTELVFFAKIFINFHAIWGHQSMQGSFGPYWPYVALYVCVCVWKIIVIPFNVNTIYIVNLLIPKLYLLSQGFLGLTARKV